MKKMTVREFFEACMKKQVDQAQQIYEERFREIDAKIQKCKSIESEVEGMSKFKNLFL
ncbi:hypothetical protein pb186bvf_015323 [Paramecium bursaria]